MWKSESYDVAREHWPRSGKVILAQYTEEAVCVYQAFRSDIAKYAVENQRLVGAPRYSTTRMTWIKTNFLWMMFRSAWGSKKNQERVLAIWLKREAFERYLGQARERGAKPLGGDNVRLQWDPDHHVDGSPHLTRRAIQLGLKNVASFSDGTDIVLIEDISDFVYQQRLIARQVSDQSLLEVSCERVFHFHFPDGETAPSDRS